MSEAIPEKVRDELFKAIGSFQWKHLQVNHFEMTHDECLHLIAPVDHLDILRTASTVADISSSEQWMPLEIPYTLDEVFRPRVFIRMRTHQGVQPPLRPRKPRWHPAASDIQQKVLHEVEHALRHGRMAAIAKHLVQTLSSRCDNGYQVRYLFPAMMQLFPEIDPGHEPALRWQAKYGDLRAPRSAPAILPFMRKLIQESSQWLTQGTLLREIPDRKPGQVELILDQNHKAPFALEDGTVLSRE